MLALSDSALAYLAIAAARIDPRRRGRWLRQIAERIDPPGIEQNNAERTPAARRQARVRSVACRKPSLRGAEAAKNESRCQNR
jgi:hypothetical protein